MVKEKKKAQKDGVDVLNQLTQTLRQIDLKQKAQNEKGMTDANGEFVNYKGLPTMKNPFPAAIMLEMLERGKKERKLRMTREELELFQDDLSDHGEPDGTLPIEIEIIDNEEDMTPPQPQENPLI